MSRSMWISATGMMAQQLNIDVISNNLANINTVGYKKSRVDFEDLMYQKLYSAGAVAGEGELPSTLQVGLGVRSVGVPKVYTQGNLTQTLNQLDVAIEGEGFFQVLLPSGELGYTRAGNFKINSEGYLTTPDGYMVEPQIQMPQGIKEIFIDPDGLIRVALHDQIELEEIGRFYIVSFPNPNGLDNLGRNIVTETPSSGQPLEASPGEMGAGTLAQGYLESSNVDIAEEMIKMIIAQRAYEINSKSIQTSDEIMAMTNNLKR